MRAFIYPFFFIGTICVFVFFFRVWKPAVGLVVRRRYLFAIIVPGSVYGLISITPVGAEETETLGSQLEAMRAAGE
ncbi:hypothetical protein [Litorimonas cladophorae]|uniref:hypothetical protein n=1 Tax=Litorimonas cladophorae TaxID=1220491 RepID=UPI001676E66E|nr:hypothetical protein [Litorimonas cladophorae]